MAADPDAFNPSFKPKINPKSKEYMRKRNIGSNLDFVESQHLWKTIKDEKNKYA